MTPEITRGMTCRLGKAKNAMEWEVLNVVSGQAYVSKLGGDGYVNKHMAVDQLLRVEPRKLEIALQDVLDTKAALIAQRNALEVALRSIKPDEVKRVAERTLSLANEFLELVTAYRAGIAEHYPHLIEAD